MTTADPIPTGALDAYRLAAIRWDRDMLNSVGGLSAWLLGMTFGFFAPYTAVAHFVMATSMARAGLAMTVGERTMWLARSLLSAALVALAVALVVRFLIPPLARIGHSRRLRKFPKAMSPIQARRRMLRAMLMFVLIVVAGLVTLAAIDANMFVVGLAKQLGGIGALSIYLGVRWRTGDDVCCARCEYAMDTAPGPNCPECGNPWLDPWRARMGHRRVSPLWVAASIATWLLLITLAIAWANIEY